MPDGQRFEIAGGMNTRLAPDAIPAGKFAYLQNVRRYYQGRITGRPVQSGPITIDGEALFGYSTPVNSMRMLNDTTPAGPTDGRALIVGSGTNAYRNTDVIQSGLSGKPLSMVAFRPPASPQAWMYVADQNAMFKCNATSSQWKTGIAEPQAAPNVATGGSGTEWVIYRYVYRSSQTGAVSNPSPESQPVTLAQTNVSATYTVDANYANRVHYNTSQYQYNLTSGVATIRNLGAPAIYPGLVTDYIYCTNWNLNIPQGVNIDGVQVTVNWAGQVDSTGLASGMALFYQNAILPGSTVKNPAQENYAYVGSAGTDLTRGNATDTWGTKLSPATLNDPTFGFGLQITVQSGSGGNTQSFVYSFTIHVYYTNVTANVTATPSSDPQVDKIDYYRMDPGLDNFTYVGTTSNSNPGLADNLSDLAVQNNPILQFDNYEPFPSIDMPRKGTCNVSGGVLQVVPSGGSGMTPGTYPMTFIGGGGSGAAGTISITASTVTSVIMTSYGSGYTSAPAVTAPTGGTPPPVLNAVVQNIVTNTGGDAFNPRWLPGTVILIGYGSTPIAYTLYNRPIGSTLVAVSTATDPTTGYPVITFPPAGTGLIWEIAEPSLAAQQVLAIWGPTDNANFYFGCGDPLRPGVLYWSKGNNFDSAPDTNQQDVTSPSEPLMNGTIVAGMGMVFSTERAWLIYPSFTTALATVQGTTGNQWSLVEASITRGLYMRYAICTDGGGRVFYRAKDCIAMTAGGQPEESITEDIYNLFTHEGAVPALVTLDGYTVYPPDDTKPNTQTLCYAKGFLYYDYQDFWGYRRTLVYDVEAKGWSVDVYGDPVSVHYWEEGAGLNGVLVGATNNTASYITALVAEPTQEVQTSVVATSSINGGDPRVQKILADLFLRAVIPSGQSVTAIPYSNRYGQQIDGVLNTLNGVGDADYLMDLTGACTGQAQDLGVIFSWPTDSGVILDYWQVDWSQTPEQISGWKTDLTGYGQTGLHGWLHIGWVNLAYKSMGPVTLTALTDQGQTISMTFPSTGGQFRKQYQIVPANKFKLISWSASAMTGTLQNPCFAQGASGWTFEGGWALGQGGLPQGVGGGTGNMAVFTGAGSAAVVNQQQIPCTPGTVISASCWALGETSATGATTLRIRFYDANGGITAVGGPGATNNYTWTQLNFSATAPAGTVAAGVDFAVINSTGGGRWWCDEFSAGYNAAGAGGGFALDAADCEMAIKGWGETGPYHIMPPFAGQSPQKGTQV